MTNSPATQASTTQTSTTQTQTRDLRALLGAALDQGGRVLARVRPDQYDDPTPCTEMTVRQLMDHLVFVTSRIEVLATTGEASLSDEVGALDEWNTAYAGYAQAAMRAWADPGLLERTIKVPWGEMSGARTLGAYTSELTIHTWDLATATGQRDVEWDADVVATSLDAMHTELPGEGRDYYPFGPAVDVSPDAPAIERLVAWAGRQP